MKKREMKKKSVTRYAVLTALLAAVPLAAAAVGNASAASVKGSHDAVVLEAASDEVGVLLKVDNAGDEQVTAVSVALSVDMKQGEGEVSFRFPETLSGAVTGSRYEDGVLHVYAAGEQGLFDENDMLSLGEVVFEGAGDSFTADVSYEDGSLQTANAAYGSRMITSAKAGDPVEVSRGNETPENPGTSQPTPEQPGTGSTDQSGNSSNSTSQTGTSQSGTSQSGTQTAETNQTKTEGTVTADQEKTSDSQKTAGTITAAKTKKAGKVTNVDPKDGPGSVLVGKESTDGSTGDVYEEIGLSDGDDTDSVAGVDESTDDAEKDYYDMTGNTEVVQLAPSLRAQIAVFAAIGILLVAVVIVRIRLSGKHRR